MSHVDLDLGVWFPEGGMVSIALGMEKLAREFGVKIDYNMPVKRIVTANGKVAGVETDRGMIKADEVLITTDYAHAELDLLSDDDRTYSRRYWEKATVAPGMLLAFLGTKKRLRGLSTTTCISPLTGMPTLIQSSRTLPGPKIRVSMQASLPKRRNPSRLLAVKTYSSWYQQHLALTIPTKRGNRFST
jgi:phytoene dehydrogenase-like protein